APARQCAGGFLAGRPGGNRRGRERTHRAPAGGGRPGTGRGRGIWPRGGTEPHRGTGRPARRGRASPPGPGRCPSGRRRPRVPTTRATAVQVFLTEYAASVNDGRRWLHQANYWLYHEAGADLSVLLPSGAVLLGVAIDNASVVPLQPGAEEVWVPLPGGAG